MAHPLGLFFVILCAVLLIAALLWNFVPALRDRMKGYSTVVEGGFGVVLSVYGEIAGGIQDAQSAGFIPPQIATYVPIAIFIWFIVKRFGTDTQVATK